MAINLSRANIRMMHWLRENPILLLFIVVAIGQMIGRIRLGGFSLGTSAVLFTGLAFGALDPDFKLPDFVYIFGLVLFVYTMGISSGPGFFSSFRSRGLRDNLMVLLVLGLGGVLAALTGKYFDLDAAYAAGLFSGALTNTPALAAVIDSLKSMGAEEAILAAPVVSYSLAYPGGVIGMLLAIYWAFRSSEKSAYRKDKEPTAQAGEKILESCVILVTKAEATAASLGHFKKKMGLLVSFARIKRGSDITIATEDSQLQLGDLVSIVGQHSALEVAASKLGEKTEMRLDLDRSSIDFRRIFVSQKSVTAVPLGSLAIGSRFGASITRIRRGDVEFIPSNQTVLDPGDRVRVVAPRGRMEEVAKFFGDSYKALSEIDVITFSIGLTLGLILGKIPLPLPDGGHFELGFAGGPLIVGLILGRLGRTGGFVWTLPFSANLTLRQLGMVLFLVGIGTRSGHAFASTLASGQGVALLMCSGAFITFVVASLILFVGRKIFKIPTGQLAGILAGTQTQPAVLAYALEQSGDESPNISYASVYPMAMIAKIIIGQLLLAFW